MDDIIELTLDSPDGIVDCRLEPKINGTEPAYNATILYPNTSSGIGRSDIYCISLRRGTKMGDYFFEEGEDLLHPKIKRLEAQISSAITRVQNKG